MTEEQKRIIEKLLQFRKDRDWEQFHTQKNLTMSLAIEASELMEQFQWSDDARDWNNVEEEVADIFAYLLYFCTDNNIDVWEALDKKIDKNSEKYPVHLSKGKSSKYKDLK